MRKKGIGALLAIMTILPQLAAAQTSPSPFTYAYRYDGMHRVTGTIAPDPDDSGPLHYAAVRNTYDEAGQVIKVEQGQLTNWPGNDAPTAWGNFGFSGSNIFRVTDITYDTAGRKLTEKVSSGGAAYSLTQYSYDANGRLECTAVRMNPAAYGSLPGACTPGSQGSEGPDRITHNYYDAAGQLTTLQRAVGTAIVQDYATYTYTPNGKQSTVTDARGYMALLTYDGFDRQSAWYFPDKTSTGTWSTSDYEAYGYDNNGNRTSLRKRDARTISYGYDALNRVTAKTYPNGGAAAVNYGYNLLGLTTSIKFASNNQGITRGYDGFGQLSSDLVVLPGINKTLTYLYDAHGNRTRMTFSNDGNYVTYSYDNLDRPTALNRSGSALIASYTYNAAGQRASFGGGYTTSYDYDGAGRLKTQTVTPANTSYQVQYGFAYNPASQMVRETRDNVAYAWTGLTTSTNNYAAANGLNQYENIDGLLMDYDPNGNLTVDRKTASTPITYAYDIENRLTSASGAYTATLTYDPLGRLYGVTQGSATTQFVYDGDALVQELNGSGSTIRRYLHGVDAGDDPIAWYEGTGFSDSNERLMRPNHQGSIAIVADRTTATVYGINTYDEYGRPGAGNLGRFQYTGQAWIPELGLYHYKARAYSPKLGRFLQTDPVGYISDMNLYAYVGGDPGNKTDPSGTCGQMHSTDATLCRINPDPDGDGEANITFVNDDPNGPSTDQFVKSELAGVVEGAVKSTGLNININSAGRDASIGSPSNHNPGKSNAIDVNKINGAPVDQSKSGAAPIGVVKTLQGAVAGQPNVRENFGPTKNERTELSGQKTDLTKSVGAGHKDHVHISSQACVRDENTCTQR